MFLGHSHIIIKWTWGLFSQNLQFEPPNPYPPTIRHKRVVPIYRNKEVFFGKTNVPLFEQFSSWLSLALVEILLSISIKYFWFCIFCVRGERNLTKTTFHNLSLGWLFYAYCRLYLLKCHDKKKISWILKLKSYLAAVIFIFIYVCSSFVIIIIYSFVFFLFSLYANVCWWNFS